MVILGIGTGPLRMRAPCRVIYTITEPQNAAASAAVRVTVTTAWSPACTGCRPSRKITAAKDFCSASSPGRQVSASTAVRSVRILAGRYLMRRGVDSHQVFTTITRTMTPASFQSPVASVSAAAASSTRISGSRN